MTEWIASLARDARRGGLPLLAAAFAAAVAIAAGLVFGAEHAAGNEMFSNPGEAVWWAMVTIATVGYGDKFPVTPGGRIFAMLLMTSGIVLTALISGSVASIYVERRIREGKGLLELKLKNHVVMCGWNGNADRVLQALAKRTSRSRTEVVVVCDLEADAFEELRSRFPSLDLRFVRGDFTNETILKKAAYKGASAFIYVPDESGQNTTMNADERIILSVLAVKAANPRATISAEILKQENERHLERAGVDDIVLNGEFSGFLLSSSREGTGLAHAARALLSHESLTHLREIPFPEHYVGKTFPEAVAGLLAQGQGLLVGVLSRETKLGLSEMLSEDSSAIDAFILRKFREADIDLAAEGSGEASVRMNPGRDYVIQNTDVAFVIGQAES